MCPPLTEPHGLVWFCDGKVLRANVHFPAPSGLGMALWLAPRTNLVGMLSVLYLLFVLPSWIGQRCSHLDILWPQRQTEQTMDGEVRSWKEAGPGGTFEPPQQPWADHQDFLRVNIKACIYWWYSLPGIFLIVKYDHNKIENHGCCLATFTSLYSPPSGILVYNSQGTGVEFTPWAMGPAGSLCLGRILTNSCTSFKISQREAKL